jgi:beta-glucosidase
MATRCFKPQLQQGHSAAPPHSSFTHSLTIHLQANGSLVGSFAVSNTGSVDSYEVTQVYVTVPPLPEGGVTPAFALKAFARVWIPAGGLPVTVPFVISAENLATTNVDGTRAVTPGVYTLFASGHMPTDPVGASQSNVISVQVSLGSS